MHMAEGRFHIALPGACPSLAGQALPPLLVRPQLLQLCASSKPREGPVRAGSHAELLALHGGLDLVLALARRLPRGDFAWPLEVDASLRKCSRLASRARLNRRRDSSPASAGVRRDARLLGRHSGYDPGLFFALALRRPHGAAVQVRLHRLQRQDRAQRRQPALLGHLRRLEPVRAVMAAALASGSTPRSRRLPARG